jgi:hypothetical protein
MGNQSNTSPLTSVTNHSIDRVPIWRSIGNYAELGFAATLVLAVVEFIDLSFQLTPVLAGSTERLALTAYSGVNLLVGTTVGATLGLAIALFTRLSSSLGTAIARGVEPRTWHRYAACLVLICAATIVVNQQSDVNNYATSMLREAEKLPHVARIVLPLEKPLSYLLIAALLVAGSMLWKLTRNSPALPKPGSWLHRFAMFAFGAIAYYFDSRIEVQQYEYSLHRTMFLVVCAASL